MNFSYEVVTERGAPIHTFDDRAKAIAFARANTLRFPGLRVEVVNRIEHRRPVWTHHPVAQAKPSLRLVERV